MGALSSRSPLASDTWSVQRRISDAALLPRHGEFSGYLVPLHHIRGDTRPRYEPIISSMLEDGLDPVSMVGLEN